MRILLAGGGSAGPVTPLLAVAEKLKQDGSDAHQFLFIGTRAGHPEKRMVEQQGLTFEGIFSGKWRRYFSWRNFLDLCLLVVGIVQAIFIIKKFKPDVILSAAGFVAVPVTWAGWLCRVPSLIHQQDIIPSLSNKLMTPLATRITVAWQKSLADFPKRKTFWVGNPIRPMILQGNRDKARQLFKLEAKLPTVLIFGGGLGAEKINELVWACLGDLIKFCQVIHLGGKNKALNNLPHNPRYHFYEFLTRDMAEALAAADLVVSRAGIGALTELSILAKPAILIPIPDSHQEANAKVFAAAGAVILLNQKELTKEKFLSVVKAVIQSPQKTKELSEKIKKFFDPQASQKIIAHLRQICYNKSESRI